MKHASVTFPCFSLEGVGNFSFISLTQIKLDVALTSLPTPPKERHQSPVRLSVCQREVPRGGISRMISCPVRKSRVRSPSECASTFQADGSHNRGAGSWPPGRCHLGDPARDWPTDPTAHFPQKWFLCPPPTQRPNWKLTWAEETSVPKRGDKISEETKYQIHIFDKNYLIMITTDLLNSHWQAEFGLENGALKSYYEARL